jgi:hypothetical protein
VLLESSTWVLCVRTRSVAEPNLSLTRRSLVARHKGGRRVTIGDGRVDRLGFPGRLAQLGERRLDKAEVTGSSPVSPIAENPGQHRDFYFSAAARVPMGYQSPAPMGWGWRAPCFRIPLQLRAGGGA